MVHLTEASFYGERTDRNIGWITPEEQTILRTSVIGIAGCGGMGGLLASTLVRLGIGEVRIADTEVFDISNINRQFAATKNTIGKSKTLETERMLKEIADDVSVRVFENGITTLSVEEFVSGCTLICDEIEFWAVGSRILLHQTARGKNIPVFTCSSVGFGSRLFYFNHTAGNTIEEMLSLQIEEAMALEMSIHQNYASSAQIQKTLYASLRALIPELPRYTAPDSLYDDRHSCIERLETEQQASIISSNPPFATGLLANWIVLTLLKVSAVKRSLPSIPSPPGYLYIDSALVRFMMVERNEVKNEFYA